MYVVQVSVVQKVQFYLYFIYSICALLPFQFFN